MYWTGFKPGRKVLRSAIIVGNQGTSGRKPGTGVCEEIRAGAVRKPGSFMNLGAPEAQREMVEICCLLVYCTSGAYDHGNSKGTLQIG